MDIDGYRWIYVEIRGGMLGYVEVRGDYFVKALCNFVLLVPRW